MARMYLEYIRIYSVYILSQPLPKQFFVDFITINFYSSNLPICPDLAIFFHSFHLSNNQIPISNRTKWLKIKLLLIQKYFLYYFPVIFQEMKNENRLIIKQFVVFFIVRLYNVITFMGTNCSTKPSQVKSNPAQPFWRTTWMKKKKMKMKMMSEL